MKIIVIKNVFVDNKQKQAEIDTLIDNLYKGLKNENSVEICNESVLKTHIEKDTIASFLMDVDAIVYIFNKSKENYFDYISNHFSKDVVILKYNVLDAILLNSNDVLFNIERQRHYLDICNIEND